MRREELTREEAIRRHRTMWNWLADQAEATGELHSKYGAFLALWPDEDWVPIAECWMCELAGDCYDGSTCALVWPNGRCAPYIGKGNEYLFSDWVFAQCMGDTKEYINLAREIANLPEREVIETCGND